MTKQIGIRALQQHASAVVREAAAGESLEITDRGRPVAMLVPIRSSGLQRLTELGLVRAARISISELPPPVEPRGGRQVTAILAEQREHER